MILKLHSLTGKLVLVGLGDDFIITSPLRGEYPIDVKAVVLNGSGHIAVTESVDEILSLISDTEAMEESA